MRKRLTFGMCLVMASMGLAQTSVDFGVEFRLRYETFVNMPNSKHERQAHTDYMRLRTRVWGKVTTGKLEGFLRIGNEFRYYTNEEARGKQRFPDVTYIDNLYLAYSDLWDWMDIRLGRQEMKFGAQRIISDGTGGDSSRTAYFDALRLTFKFTDKRTLDAFVTYNTAEDWLPTLGHTHAARGMNSKGYDYDLSGYNHDEFGVGLYYTDKSFEGLPWEAYYVYKVELDGDCPGNNVSSVMPVDSNAFSTHTFGVRLLPQFTETLSGELEVAGQLGDDSLRALMAYAGLTYAPDIAWHPKFTLAVHYLSGDKAGTRGEHAWHAVFNRETGIGDLVAGMFDKNAYINFLYPHVKVEVTPAEYHKLSFQTGPQFAPIAEQDGNGGHYGHFRGYFMQVKYTLALGRYLDWQYARSLACAVTGEWLSKGDYFKPGERDDAFFCRLETTCAF